MTLVPGAAVRPQGLGGADGGGGGGGDRGRGGVENLVI